MRECIVLLAVLPILAFADCSAGTGNPSFVPCGRQTVILVDSTSYMGTRVETNQLFNYMRTLLSTYAFDDSNQVFFSLGYYGAYNPGQDCSFGFYDGDRTPRAICDSFYGLQISHDDTYPGNLTLTQLVNKLINAEANQLRTYPPYDHVILFSASTNQTDLNLAPQYLGGLNASFTVVNMGSPADFYSWPNTREIDVPLQFPLPDYLAELIISTQCGYQDSTTDGWDTTWEGVTTGQPTFYPIETTVQSASTLQPTFQPTVQPTTQNCPCNPSKSWNDIFLLFDGSNGLAANRFEELVDYVFSTMGQLTIGQGVQYQTRAGIITYGDQAQLFANLDHYTDTYSFVDDIDNVKRTNTDGTNIDGAINIASDSFKSSAHRQTSRKVMIIGASTYRIGGYESPLAKAKSFKDNGGIIIVIAFGDSNGDVAPELKEIASPQYYIDASKSVAKVQDLISLICSANCFCPSSYTADSTTHRGDPDDGCYQTSTLEATNQLAKHYCSREHQGKLSTVITPAQQIFVSKDVTGKEPIYVGLERSHGQWTWADGSPFTGVINDNGGDCATLTRVKGFKTEFDSAQCTVPYLYSCQATPCSTEIFCTQF